MEGYEAPNEERRIEGMRLLGVLGVLCFAVAPTMAGPVNIECNPGGMGIIPGAFDVIAGVLVVDVSPDGIASPDPVTVGVDGTFGLTIYASDGHIGESDTFTLGPSGIYNSETVAISLLNLATATILPADAVFLDFAPATPGHIGPGGIGIIETDVYIEVLAYVTGLLNTTLDTRSWAGELMPFLVGISTTVIVEESGVITAGIMGTFVYEIGVSDISQTLTLDLIIDIIGTAHMVPDPAFGGLTALGLAGAGAWLRRRR